jgi:hypothetical protein
MALLSVLLVAGGFLGFPDFGRADDLADRLRDLRVVTSAIRLQGECVGFTCTRSPYYAAFNRVVGTPSVTLDEILEAYSRALPAGRVYLAAAILKKDKERGETVLRELARSSTPVVKESGCIFEFTTVGSAAAFVLANDGLPSFW